MKKKAGNASPIVSTESTGPRPTFVGTVCRLRKEAEPSAGTQPKLLWGFVLASGDGSRERQELVSVEMRAFSFEGSLEEGDQVEVFDKIVPGKTVHAKRVFNRSTMSEVRARSASETGGKLVFIAIILIIALVIGMAIFGLTKH